MARIDHTACTHPRTPAGRRACRNAPVTMASVAREMFTTPDPVVADFTIDTPAGKIRVGSVVEVRITGERGLVRGKLTEVSEDIKNGEAGCTSMNADRPFWVYANQVVRVVTF